jgi:hypothetical protein
VVHASLRTPALHIPARRPSSSSLDRPRSHWQHDDGVTALGSGGSSLMHCARVWGWTRADIDPIGGCGGRRRCSWIGFWREPFASRAGRIAQRRQVASKSGVCWCQSLVAVAAAGMLSPRLGTILQPQAMHDRYKNVFDWLHEVSPYVITVSAYIPTPGAAPLRDLHTVRLRTVLRPSLFRRTLCCAMLDSV